MPKKKAFTLVELLVVIAIIALLISILAPSLQNARKLAKQMMCGQNLRSIGSAIQTYAAANRDYVPPYGNSQEDRDEVLGLESNLPFTLPMAFTPTQDALGENEARGLGFLHNEYSDSDAPSTLYVEDWRIFYCPGQPRTKPDKVDGHYASFYEELMAKYNSPWKETTMGFPGNTVYTSYTYNPNPVMKADNLWYPRYPKIDNFPAESVLGLDLLLSGTAFVAHWIGAPSWNVCFADSHVENIVSQDFEQMHTEFPGSSHDFEEFLGLTNFLMYGVETH